MKMAKFILGIVLSVLAYFGVQLLAPSIGLGPIIAAILGGVACGLVFFGFGALFGYVQFTKPEDRE